MIFEKNINEGETLDNFCHFLILLNVLNFKKMSKAAVLEEMKRNGVNSHLQAIYVVEIAKAIQESSIDSMKMLKSPKQEQEYLLANQIVLDYLQKIKFDETAQTLSIETKDTFSKSKINPETDLQIPKNQSKIKYLLNSKNKQQNKQNHDNLRNQISNRLEKIEKEDQKPAENTQKPKEQPVAEVQIEQSYYSTELSLEEEPKPVEKPQPVQKNAPQKQEVKEEQSDYSVNMDFDDDEPKVVAKPNQPQNGQVFEVKSDEYDDLNLDSSEPQKPVKNDKPAQQKAVQQKQKADTSSGMNFSFPESDSVEVPTKVHAPQSKDDDSSGVLDFDEEVVHMKNTKTREVPQEESTSGLADLNFDSDEPVKPAPKAAAASKPAQKSEIDETSSMNFDFDNNEEKQSKVAQKPSTPAKQSKQSSASNKNPAVKSDDSDIDVNFSSSDDIDFDL